MNTKQIPIYEEIDSKKMYLEDALKAEGAEFIPSKCVINKVLPGLGATHMEITAKRHSIIIEPNVPVILGKKEQHGDDVLAVYEDCTPKQVKDYLLNEKIKWKKIISTPEGYIKKVVPAIKASKVDVYNDYFLLFDEVEKITQDCGYRPNIAKPINDLFDKFKNKAFVSATPLSFSDPRFEEQGFEIIEIDPQWNYRKDLTLITTNDFDNAFLDYFDKHKSSNCICIFLNSTNSINEIIHSLGINDESKVFCSERSYKKLQKVDFKNVHYNLHFPLAKYNFFTSRFFSAVDILLTDAETPDILLLTNDVQFTQIDPSTEAIQIYGRFRNGFKSLTHIAMSLPEDTIIKSDADLLEGLEKSKEIYEYLKDDLEKVYANDLFNIQTDAINEDLKNLRYKRFLDENENKNHFAVDNLLDDFRVLRHYQTPETIKRAYKNTSHFNITHEDATSESIRVLFHIRKYSGKEKRKKIVEELESLNTDCLNGTISETKKEEYIDILRREDNEIVDIYNALGKSEIEQQKYNITRLKDKQTKYQSEQRRLSKEVAQAIFDNFEGGEGIPISKASIKTEIERIYKTLGIPNKVSLTTIEDYYNKPVNSGSKRTYTLTQDKRKIF